MVLADLIRGTGAVKGTVAKVARVAVANPQKVIANHHNPEANTESAEIATATLATFATVTELSAADEAVIRTWLSSIGETDQHLIEATVRWARVDEASRAWALAQALPAVELTVEASCKRCRHVTRYGNCGVPVEAGLANRFVLTNHAAGGRGCAAFQTEAT